MNEEQLALLAALVGRLNTAVKGFGNDPIEGYGLYESSSIELVLAGNFPQNVTLEWRRSDDTGFIVMRP